MKIGFDYIGITTPFYCHNGNGKLLMHKRTNKCRDEHNKWDAGSGKLEFGLSLEENVLKEILEEYGCSGLIEEQMPPQDIFRDQNGLKTHWVAIPFFIKVNPLEVKNNEPEKMEQLGWFSIDNLPEPLHTGFAHSLKNYRHYFEKYLGKTRTLEN